MSNVAPTNVSDSARLMRDAITIMSQHNWEMKIHLQDMAQFEKKGSPNSCVSLLLILALSLVGTLLVCLSIAGAKKERVTFQIDGPDLLNATSSRGTFRVEDQAHLVKIAQMVSDGGTTYAGAILLGIVSMGFWAVLLPLLSGM